MGLMSMGLVMGDSLRAALWKYGPLCPIFFTWLSFTFSYMWGRLRTEHLLLSSVCAWLMPSLSTLQKKQGLPQSSPVYWPVGYKNVKEIPGFLQCCKSDQIIFITIWSLKSVHLQNNQGRLWTVLNGTLHIQCVALPDHFWASMKEALTQKGQIPKCKIF